MGFPKSNLPFGDELLLQRVVRRLSESVDGVFVVRAAEQEIPELPIGVTVVDDDQPALGPLQGISCGLRAANHRYDFAFVMSCDAPFMQNAFIKRLVELRNHSDIVITADEHRMHPLAAIYRTSLHSVAANLLHEGVRRPIALVDHAKVAKVATQSLRTVDPELESLLNLNDREAYRESLLRAGLKIPASFES